MTKYVVRSSVGYVSNSQTLEVTTDPMEAAWMNIAAAAEVIQRMEASGFAADLVKLRFGGHPCPQLRALLFQDGDQFFAASPEFEDLQSSSVVWLGPAGRFMVKRALRKLQEVNDEQTTRRRRP
jgi:hypothetical protein